MSWAEEITALRLQVKRRGIRKVQTPEGSERYGQPIGTIIRPGVDLPKPPRGGKKKPPVPTQPRVDKRTTGGQTPGKFVHPVTGHQMGKTEVGDTFEQLFQAKMRKGLEEHFGCCLKLITGAGGGTARNTPLDFGIGKRGGEVKTLNALAKNQKTAIKKEEVARKVAACRSLGVEPLLVVQVVDQESGEVHVYGHPAFASKAVKTMTYFGSYKFTARDFQQAQQKSGHWEKAGTRAAAEREKAGAAQTKQLGVGEPYDPPDEEGGVIESGDTVIELREVDGWMIPHIYTAGEEGEEEEEKEEEEEGEEKGLRRVRTPEGARRYDQPIGSVITPSLPEPHLLPRLRPDPPDLRFRHHLTRARPSPSHAFTRTPTQDPKDVPISAAVEDGFHQGLPNVDPSSDPLTRIDPLHDEDNRSFSKREVAARLYQSLGAADQAEMERIGGERARTLNPSIVNYLPDDPFSPDALWVTNNSLAGRWDMTMIPSRGVPPLGVRDEDGTEWRAGDDPVIRAAAGEQAVSDFIATWAITSNDADIRSLAVQDAAVEEFDLEKALDWEGGVDWSSAPEESLAALNAAQRESVERMVAQQAEERSNIPLYRRLLRAMYDDTQKWLAERGIDEVVLHRGMQWDDRHEPPPWVHLAGDDALTGLPKTVDSDEDEVRFRPLSSWSASYRIAQSFGHDNGVVLSTVVPAELILSVPRSGFGALPEWEFVVLAPSGGKYMLREP